jgi:hypothetical protein
MFTTHRTHASKTHAINSGKAVEQTVIISKMRVDTDGANYLVQKMIS